MFLRRIFTVCLIAIVAAVQFGPECSSADDSSFFAGRRYQIDTVFGAREAFLADFNNDGVEDVATFTFSSISILLSNGDGSLGEPSVMTLDYGIESPVAADFTGDGLVDLAIINGTDLVVELHTGLGDGTFQFTQQFGVDDTPQALFKADINNDGFVDLLVEKNVSEVGILLNSGGSFQAEVITKVSIGASNLVSVDDFNGDDIPDFAIRSSTTVLDVWLGDGNGEFNLVANTGQFFTGRLFAGHFDSDGIVDIFSFDSSMMLFSGNGDGTFATGVPVAPISLPISTGAVLASDISGDGLLDLVLVGSSLNNTLIYVNESGVSFEEPQIFSGGLEASSIAAGDFSGDGIVDLVITNQETNDISTLVSIANGRFGGNPVFELGVLDPFVDALSVDLNNDGLDDIIVPQRDENSVLVTFADGGTEFSQPQFFGTGLFPVSAAAADFNGDGNPDIVTANRNSGDVSLLLGNGDGTFAEEARVDVDFQPQAVLVGNFNQDEFIDLVTLNSAETASVLLGAGDGSFSTPINTPGVIFESTRLADVGDFNGDGLSDLATIRDVNRVDIFLATGDGTFIIKDTIFVVPVPRYLDTADFNGDGLSDLAMASRPSGGTGTAIMIRFGDDNQMFDDQQIFIVDDLSFPMREVGGFATGDFNSDGFIDAAIAIEYFGSVPFVLSGCLAVLPGAGSGDFGQFELYDLNTAPRSILKGNFDFGQSTDMIVQVAFDGLDAQLFSDQNQFVLGDVNRDCQVNLLDVNPFVQLLLSDGFQIEADIDLDGDLTLLDVPGLIELLSN